MMCTFTVRALGWRFRKYLFADLVQSVRAAVREAQLHVNGVVEQS